MVLWWAVLPFPSSAWFFFPSSLFVGHASFGCCLSLFSCCFLLLYLCWVLGCEYGCHTLLWDFFIGILLPSLSPWSICSWCGLSSQSLEPSFSCSCAPSFFVPSLLWLWFDLLFLFSWCFLQLPSVRCVSQNFPFFVFRCEDVLSAFRFFLSCRLSCPCQVWRSRVFSSFVGAGYGAFCLWSLVLKAVSSSLGSGKFCSPVFVCGRSPFHFFSRLLSSACG